MKDAILSEKSPFAYSESFKTLRANFNFTTLNGKLKKILITSALPSERWGKDPSTRFACSG